MRSQYGLRPYLPDQAQVEGLGNDDHGHKRDYGERRLHSACSRARNVSSPSPLPLVLAAWMQQVQLLAAHAHAST